MRVAISGTGWGLAFLVILGGTRTARADEGDNTLTPTATIKLDASIPDLVFSPNRSWLYLLNTSEGKIQRIDPAKAKLDTVEAELTDGTERMALSPDGKTLYTCASPGGHTRSFTPGKSQTGKIQAVDAATLKAGSAFSIALDPFDIKAGPEGKVYVSGGSGQWTELAIVDVSKKSIVGKLATLWERTYLEMTPDGKRLYHSSTGISPGTIDSVGVDSTAGPAAGAGEVRSDNDHPLEGWFQITPDGKYLVVNTGTILRLAKNRQDDLKPTGKIDKHLCCATDKNCNVLLVATEDGSLKVYSYPDFELKATYVLKAPACRMVLDGTSGTLYCATETKKREQLGRRPSPAGVGDIQVYDVSKLLSSR